MFSNPEEKREVLAVLIGHKAAVAIIEKMLNGDASASSCEQMLRIHKRCIEGIQRLIEGEGESEKERDGYEYCEHSQTIRCLGKCGLLTCADCQTENNICIICIAVCLEVGCDSKEVFLTCDHCKVFGCENHLDQFRIECHCCHKDFCGDCAEAIEKSEGNICEACRDECEERCHAGIDDCTCSDDESSNSD